MATSTSTPRLAPGSNAKQSGGTKTLHGVHLRPEDFPDDLHCAGLRLQVGRTKPSGPQEDAAPGDQD